MKYSEALVRHTFPRSRRWSRLHVGAARIAIAERFGMRHRAFEDSTLDAWHVVAPLDGATASLASRN